MRESELQPFVAAIEEVRQLLAPRSPALTSGAIALWWRSLAGFELHAIQAALDAHIADPVRGNFPPVPADVLRHLSAASSDGRPGPEEAWAIALLAKDEAETVVWTDEIADAFNVCRSVLNAGDEVGARMAFKETYTRLVQTRRGPVEWSVCLGWDADRRRLAVTTAVEDGRLATHHLIGLTAPSAQLQLPAPDDAESMGPKEREARAKLAEWAKQGKEPRPIDTSSRDALTTEQRDARRLLMATARRMRQQQDTDLHAAAVALAARQDAIDAEHAVRDAQFADVRPAP